MKYGRKSLHDKIVFYSLAIPAIIIALILLLLLLTQTSLSIPIFNVQGVTSTYISTTWRPSYEPPPTGAWYGLLPAIWGTLTSAIIAVLLALPLSLSVVIFVEEILPRRFREYISTIIDLMAGMPTVLFGIWGLSFLGPILQAYVMTPLHEYLGFIPVFSCKPLAPATVLTAGVLLSLMIFPFMVVVIQETYRAIPITYKEAGWSLGLTMYEYVKLNMSMISPAIVSAILLGFGRASSETAAVALVVGNAYNIGFCILSPAYTISSLIANQFTESGDFPYMQNALFAGGLILLIIGLIVNTIGIILLRRLRF